MSNNIYKFKTNIKCSGCVRSIQSGMDNLKDIERWEVDTNHADKILTVVSVSPNTDSIEDTIQSLGYQIELIQP